MYKPISAWDTESLDVRKYHKKEMITQSPEKEMYNEHKYGGSEASKYGGSGNSADVYSRNEGGIPEEKKAQDDENTISGRVEKELKKDEEETNPQIGINMLNQPIVPAIEDIKKSSKKSKSTIEDAINKAIKQEKDVIIID